MKLTKLDAEACCVLRTQGIEAINKALADFGVAAHIDKTMRYDGAKIECKLAFILSDGDAVVALSKAAENEFRMSAPMFGFDPNDFGREFKSGKDRYRIVGLAGGRSTKIKIERMRDGKVFLAHPESVQSGLRMEKLNADLATA